ncbi:MAG TPA: hypothetical protein VLU24_10235 [Mycobacterium sp.]|nr:hypothetical protein [Mycobacterium sp.]
MSGLELSGDLDITLKTVATGIKAVAEQTAILSRVITTITPTPRSLVLTQSVPAAGLAVFDLGSPQPGTRWNVKRVGVVRGDDVTQTLGGRADIFVGKVTVQAGVAGQTLPTEGWKWSFATLPAVTSYSDNTITVQSGNNLIVIISGGTGGQQANVNAEVEVISDAALGAGTAVQTW